MESTSIRTRRTEAFGTYGLLRIWWDNVQHDGTSEIRLEITTFVGNLKQMTAGITRAKKRDVDLTSSQSEDGRTTCI